jgi:flavin reductase (DIM6/NTAB) family NADH-FMN oxidoreductase RutF
MSAQAQLAEAISPNELRRAFSVFPTGVVAVCALIEGKPVGFAVNSFNSVSLDPPLVSICVGNTSSTWPLLAKAERLGLTVLGAGHSELCRKLASRTADRFDGAAWTTKNNGAILIDGGALWLECRQSAAFPAGDHEMIMLEVHEAELFAETDPLVFHQSQFRELMGDA